MLVNYLQGEDSDSVPDISSLDCMETKLKGIIKGRFRDFGYTGYTNDYNISTISTPAEIFESGSGKTPVSIGDNNMSALRLSRNCDQDQMNPKMNMDELLVPKAQKDDSYFIASSSIPRRLSSSSNNWTRDSHRSSNLVNGRISHANYRNGSSAPPPKSCSYSWSVIIRKTVLLRLFQIASILFIFMGIFILVTPSSSSNNNLEIPQNETNPYNDWMGVSKEIELTENSHNKIDIREALQKWTTTEISNTSHLLNLTNFHFTLNNQGLCGSHHNGPNSTSSNGIYFVILVHSAPDHFNERQAIRTSWGSVRSLRNWTIRVIFLLGQFNSGDQGIQANILAESDLYGDIASGTFEDTYRNLTYKHLMAYTWAVSYCPEAKFIIKTDDDAFIDIFQVMDFTQRNYGLNPADILLCNIYPEGTKPVRNSKNIEGSKWLVTSDEYPFPIYPKYCGGLGYLVTMDVINRLLEMASKVHRFFWIDDVFVTGILRELTAKEPFYLNVRYSYDENEYLNWLNDRSPRHRLRKIPFMFVHVPRGWRYDDDMARLWRKTVRAWS